MYNTEITLYNWFVDRAYELLGSLSSQTPLWKSQSTSKILQPISIGYIFLIILLNMFSSYFEMIPLTHIMSCLIFIFYNRSD